MANFRKMIAMGLLSATAALVAAGCGGGNDSKGSGKDESSGSGYSASDEDKGDKGSGDGVKFTSPVDGSEVGPDFTAVVELEDFELAADQVGKENADGSGHIHFQLDGGEFDKLPYSETGELAEQLGVDGKYSPNVKPQMSYQGIPEGEHTLKVFLVNNDHSDTGTEDEVKFTVSGDAGSVAAPAAGSTVGDTTTVEVKLPDDFTINAENVGKENAEGEGHLHYQLDGGKFDKLPYSETGALAAKLGIEGKYSPNVKPTLTYKGLPKGDHQLVVFLANNDHSHTDRQYATTFTVE